MDEEGGWYGEVLDERGEMVEVRSQNETIRLGTSQPDGGFQKGIINSGPSGQRTEG